MAPTTNNWVKDGLDAYLSLTGMYQAEKKAERDEKKAERDSAYQQQSMQLAVNADQRAQAASELAIDEGKRKAQDRERFAVGLRDMVHKVNLQDSSIPNTFDPTEIEQARQSAAGLANLAGQLDQLPDGYAQEWKPTDVPPEFQKFADDEGLAKAAQRRAGKEFTDPATGKKYVLTGNLSSYKVVKPAGGKAQVRPMLEAHDPEDKTAVLEVPFTKRGTNEPDDEVNVVTSDMFLHKAGSRLSVLNAAEQSGKSPVELKTEEDMKWLAMLPYETQVAVVQHMATTMLDKKTKGKDPLILSQGAKAFSPDGTKELASNPKTNEDAPKVVTVGVGNDQEQAMQYNPASKRYDIPVGKPTAKHAPKDASGAGKDRVRAKIEINRRLHYAVRDYQAALKTGDPESINESITLIEQLNADATELGAKPQPLPNRPFSREEEDSIKERAIKNLTEKQGATAKLLGIKPSVPAINLEIKQLKSTVKPGSGFNFVSPKPTQQPSIMDVMPPAKQHAGRLIQDDTTGKKYRSNGSQWLEVH
ncbi:MAG: hypothetical protein PHY09_00850 [Desulfuromonadaceae bacterium]|nr:hypothetical protein [Desulfuromonadaceae bacterium]MDD5104863.1 hypothetical protein [Desulfuromonadaceae bacterium]